MIKHFVFTNVGIGIFDPRWIIYRVELFERTVYRSLNAQTNYDFMWFVFIDKNIDFLFKQKIHLLAARARCKMVVKEVEAYSDVAAVIGDITRDVPSDDVLVTTRIDDDDIILCCAIDEIQLVAKRLPSKYSLCSFGTGYEYLVADGIVRDISCNTLALGLSMVVPAGNKKISITSFAHHLIEDTLAKQGIDFCSETLCAGRPSWFYTKHSISDSVFFGARARILGDPSKKTIDEVDLDGFAVTHDDLNCLKNIMADAPFGMPFKYLERFSSVRNGKLPDYFQRIFSNFATRDNPVKSLRNGKIRVAIIGSCVSRDLFEIESHLRGQFEVVFYSARSSVISYCSLPIVDKSVVVKGEGFEDTRAQYDLNKTHWEKLRESRPDIVLVDFIDERIGIIQYKGSSFSASGPVVKAFERAGVDVEVIRPWDPLLTDLRRFSVKVFMERVRDVCPNIIVHKASWCVDYLDNNRNVLSFGDTKWAAQIELNNKIIDSMLREIESHWVPFDAIEVVGDANKSGGAHKWDLSPFHYDHLYYRQLAKLLKNRVSLDA